MSEARDAIENPLTATAETTRVVVSNYVCMGITIIVLVARAALTAVWKRKIGSDDILLYLALGVGIIESVLTEKSVGRGLGTYIRPGNSAKLYSLSELVYASDLFFLVAMLLAKLSVVRLVYRFASRSATSRGKLMILQICIGFWATFSVPAIAFQCGTSIPWLYLPDRCIGSGALWYPVLAISILLDAWLSLCAWTAVPEMQIGSKQRQAVLSVFGSRVFACILGVVQLALLSPALKSINQPRAMPNPTVLKQFVMNASILTAAIPVLYRTLATYTPSTSAEAMIYNKDDEHNVSSPLEEFKISTSTVLPHPKKFEGGVTETELKTPPSLGTYNNDFSSRFSMAFNKEIGATSTKTAS